MRRIAALLLLLVPGFVWGAGTVNNFILPSDAASKYSSVIRSAPTYVDAMVLVANTPAVWTAPANVRFVVFSGNCNFHAKPNAAAAVPGASVSDGTASEMNPAAWYSPTPFTSIGFSASTACVVTISAYLGRTP